MKLIIKTLEALGKKEQTIEGLNIITLIEQEPNALEEMSKILNIPFVSSKEQFEDTYVASLTQDIGETDEMFQQRLTRLNENKFIPAVNKITERKILFCIDPTSEALDKFCNWEYGLMSLSTYKNITGLTSQLSITFDENEDMPSFIRKILKFILDNKATDINLISMQTTLSMIAKISGEWTEPIGTLPIAYKNKFLISLCSLANPKPEDYKSGKSLKFRIGQEIDGINILFRIQITTQTWGEEIAIRKLPTIGTLPNINKLGLSDESINFIKRVVKTIDSPKKGGLVIIVGETGSGKSTLLSAIEAEYLKIKKKVNTSEDPVENKFSNPYLSQTEVGSDSGMTHMIALENFLRLNSDVIVIGECRNSEEFSSVISASLSGHFTYTTYHTGSVADTLIRLQAMGLDLNLIAGALKAIIATTLIPKLCDSCKIPTKSGRFIRNKCDCPTCKGRGIDGVVPVTENARFTTNIKRMIGTHSLTEIIEAMRKEDYISMSSQITRLKDLGLIDEEISDVLE